MALYIGNRKIAALSQTISPDYVGDGLSVDNGGKLQIAWEDLVGILANMISGEYDSETAPMDDFI